MMFNRKEALDHFKDAYNDLQLKVSLDENYTEQEKHIILQGLKLQLDKVKLDIIDLPEGTKILIQPDID